MGILSVMRSGERRGTDATAMRVTNPWSKHWLREFCDDEHSSSMHLEEGAAGSEGKYVTALRLRGFEHLWVPCTDACAPIG